MIVGGMITHMAARPTTASAIAAISRSDQHARAAGDARSGCAAAFPRRSAAAAGAAGRAGGDAGLGGLRRAVIGEHRLVGVGVGVGRAVAGDSPATAVSAAATAPRAESRLSHRGMSTQSQIAMIAR